MVPRKSAMATEYYVNNVLRTASPAIRSKTIQQDGYFIWQQDLATLHAASFAQDYLQKEKALATPWMPKGADCNPLDLFARDSIKEALERTPKESYGALKKLEATLLHAIEELRADHEWVRKAAEAYRSAPKRLRWLSENGGNEIKGKPWRKANYNAGYGNEMAEKPRRARGVKLN